MRRARCRPWTARNPGLPLKKGRCGTLTHDYKRNGTTTMFARAQYAGRLDYRDLYAEASSSGMDPVSQSDQTFRGRKTNRSISFATTTPTHKHQKVVNWLKRNTRFHVHFTPTSASWLNMVERFFRDLSEQRLRRGVFHSVPELIQAVEEYVGGHNQNPKPFIWTATASDILEKSSTCPKEAR